MEFIIMKFLALLIRDYHINSNISKTDTNLYTLYMHDVDYELMQELLKLIYKRIDIGEKYNAKGEIIGTYPITTEEKICISNYKLKDGKYRSIIEVTLAKDNYGEKINKIDFTIKRFFESHSPIDRINGKI